MKYRCVNFYSAEWDGIYPLPGYVIEEYVNNEEDKDDDGSITVF